MRDILEEYTGVKLLVAVFGFAGGLISLSVAGAKTPLVAISCVFAGLFSAVAFTPVVHSIWGYPDTFQSGISFVLGISGMTLVRFIYERLSGNTIGDMISKRMKSPLPPDSGTSRGAVDDAPGDK